MSERLIANYVHRMHSISGMTGSHHSTMLGYLVLGLAGIICGVSSLEVCSPQPLTGSTQHNVQALTDHARPCLTGCVAAASQNTEVPEVHVINMRAATASSAVPSTATSTSSSSGVADSQSPDSPREVVSFHFEPTHSKFLARSLVFYLNSATPVRWNVDGKGILFMYPVKIVAPLHSCQHVDWNRAVLPSVSLTCASLPQNNADLLNFTRKEYSNISSFSEVYSANNISLLVGSGISSPRTCQIQAGFQTPYFTARYLVQQPVTGCHSPKPTVPLPREFHAILLQGVTGNPATGTSEYPPLVVDVLVKGTGDSMRSVVLWLVSEANVSWKIRTQGILGQLEVKSPNEVLTRGTQMSREWVALPHTQEQLLARAAEESWPMTTFTSATDANKFVVTLERKDPPTQEPPSRSSILKQYTEVDCKPDSIQVRIQSSVMGVCRLNLANMMLRDHSCKATLSAEGNYFVIQAGLDECGTTKTEMEMEREAYHNEVIFSNAESVMEGSGESDVHRDRLMGVLPVDDEEQSLTLRIPFTCEYAADGSPLMEDLMGPGKSQVTLTMDMYTSNSYGQIQTSFPHTVQTGERVYFQVSLADTEPLRVVPSQCWLATGRKGLTSQTHMLIYKGCAMDDSLIFHRDPVQSGQLQRFSYEVPDIQWDAMHYVHCELGICSTNEYRLVPRCTSIMDPFTGCLRMVNGDVVDFPTHSLSIGPFKTTTTSLATPNDSGFISRGSQDQVEPISNVEECQEGLGTGPAAAIAIASFIMGMVLIGALWCIHTHTGPHTGPPPSASPCTVSTASSPSANGHLMNGHIPNGTLPNGGALPNGTLPHCAGAPLGPALPPCPGPPLPNGHVPAGFLGNRLNPNGIPLQGMRHVDNLPEDV